MTKFLASVNNLSDAILVAELGADFVDLKQPNQGALGALPVNEVRQIVDILKPTVQISATVGDLAFVPEVIIPAVHAMIETHVDIVKIGIFPGGDVHNCLESLTQFTNDNHKLIAVLFADSDFDLQLLPVLAATKFSGVMLDTMHKSSGSLADLLTHEQLSDFVSSAQKLNLLTGLAGSLKAEDITALLDLNADYLGFRGALCRGLQRTDIIDATQVSYIRQLIPSVP